MPPEEEEIIDYGTTPCKWEKSEPKVVTFFEDDEITEETIFEPGDELVSGGEGGGMEGKVEGWRRMWREGRKGGERWNEGDRGKEG